MQSINCLDQQTQVLNFCKQIVDNLVHLDNKKRKQTIDRDMIIREHKQLQSQINMALLIHSFQLNH